MIGGFIGSPIGGVIDDEAVGALAIASVTFSLASYLAKDTLTSYQAQDSIVAPSGSATLTAAD
jgi:hypothetical protein